MERFGEFVEPEWELSANFAWKTDYEKIQEVQQVIEKKNLKIMERKAGETLGIMYFKTKEVEERYDVVDDFTRGRVTQQIKDLGDGFDPQESRLVVDHVEKYIAYHEKRLEDNIIKAGHMDQIRIRISYYKMWVQESGIVAVKKIGDKSHIDAYFDYLRNKQKDGAFGDRYRKYLFAGFKSFLQWLKQEGILPDFNPPWTNLRNDPYKIKVKKTKPKLISITNFRKIYDKAPPRLQLFMCLIANCGCGEGEIGRLEKSEYRPKSGRIVHTRVKTEDMEDTPEVNYLLWDRTKDLLEQQLKAQKKYKRKQNDRDYLLVNHNGNPLWWERYEATEKNPVKHHIRSDSIRQEFDEFIKKIQKEDKELAKIEIKFYMIRRKIASMIYSNPTFRPLDWIWLGHAPPKTTSKQYYVDPNPKILDDCLKWIEQKLFVDPIDPEEDDHDFYFE